MLSSVSKQLSNLGKSVNFNNPLSLYIFNCFNIILARDRFELFKSNFSQLKIKLYSDIKFIKKYIRYDLSFLILFNLIFINVNREEVDISYDIANVSMTVAIFDEVFGNFYKVLIILQSDPNISFHSFLLSVFYKEKNVQFN